MFSTITSPSIFNSNRRLERHSRQGLDANTFKQPRRQESVLINNVNLALSGLSPNHKTHHSPSVYSPQNSVLAYASGRNAWPTQSTSSTSSLGSIKSFQSSQSEQTPRQYIRSSQEQTTPKASSFYEADPVHKTKAPFWSRGAYTPRPSIDSTSSSSSGGSWLHMKERKAPPPPLHLRQSNLYPQHHEEPPVIEIVAPGPPRVESRLSTHSVQVMSPAYPAQISPASPATPSEEEIKRRRHEKVMRTLGEPVPAELVYRAPKILNVTVFPEPPSPEKEDTPKNGTMKLARRTSFTLSSFPNLSTVTSTLLPTSHLRSKSKEVLGYYSNSPTKAPSENHSADIISPPRPPQRNPLRSVTQPRPESVHSPISSSYDAEQTPTPRPQRSLPEDAEAERAEKLARRASLSTATFLITSPMRDGLRDLSSPRSSSYRTRTEPLSPASPTIHPRPRHESLMLSPIAFAKHASYIVPPEQEFLYMVNGKEVSLDDDEDQIQDDEDLDSNTAGSRTPPSREYTQSEMGHYGGRTSNGPSRPIHRGHPFYSRPDTPFEGTGIPLERNPGYRGLPQGLGHDLVSRREKRQGWSGEWNQGDMQEVIKKLRNLK